MNAKIKQIETLKLENARQKKKLQARLTYFDGRCQTLEAQLGEQRGKLQKVEKAASRGFVMSLLTAHSASFTLVNITLQLVLPSCRNWMKSRPLLRNHAEKMKMTINVFW